MTNKYNYTSERLWEKLEFYRKDLDLSVVNFKEPFPIDQLVSKNPVVKKYIKEVEKEFNYEMSEFQCSWAVNIMIKGGKRMMGIYNKKNKTNLKSRA